MGHYGVVGDWIHIIMNLQHKKATNDRLSG